MPRSRPQAETVDADAYTVAEFCRRHRIGRSLFYQLQREGKGPRLTRLGGRKVLVLREDAAAWREQVARGAS